MVARWLAVISLSSVFTAIANHVSTTIAIIIVNIVNIINNDT